jgi:hypothetical protein
MTNLKHCHLPIPHFTVINGKPHIGPGAWFCECTICLVTGNFEWDSNVAQLKDVDFLLLSVSWNKFQLALCIFFNMQKLIFIFCAMRFCSSYRVYPYPALRMEAARQSDNPHCPTRLHGFITQNPKIIIFTAATTFSPRRYLNEPSGTAYFILICIIRQ